MNKLGNFLGLVSCVLFAGFVFCEWQAEAGRCMGLSFINEEQLAEMAKDHTNEKVGKNTDFCFCGECVYRHCIDQCNRHTGDCNQ